MDTKDSKSRQYSILFQLFSLIIFFGLFMPQMSQARMALPEVGINYQTMLVEAPAILKEAGMKDVKKGDKIKMDISEDGIITFTNEKNGAKAIIKPLKTYNTR